MKKLTFLVALLCTFLGLQAQIRGNEINVMVTPDHADWNYHCGETVKFTVQVFKAQCLLPGASIDYVLGPEMYPETEKKDVVLKDGKLEVKGTMKTPGFYRLKVTAKVNGRSYVGLATAAFDQEKLTPTTQMPQDFQSYWSSALEEARKIPLDVKMELLPSRCTETVNVYHVSYQNMRRGSRTYGILCMPKAPGKYPALLRVPGAGVRAYYGDVETASKGAITLEIGIHGIPVTMTDDFYNNLASGPLNHYFLDDQDDRDMNYYKRVFIGAVRGVDFICNLEQYNGKALGVTGASQGGMLSLVTAALDKRVTFLAGIHPAMCDHTASLIGRACGWPHYFYGVKNPDPKKVENSRYYDAVNFGAFVDVPAWFSWGYNDDVVSPTAMHAMYNSLKCTKELHPYLQTAHFWYQEQYDAWNQWLWKMMGL